MEEGVSKLRISDYRVNADRLLKTEFDKLSSTPVTERISFLSACSGVPLVILCLRYLDTIEVGNELVSKQLTDHIKYYNVVLV